MMLSFPVFAWLSHAGVLWGAAIAHAGGGAVLFVIAFDGFWIISEVSYINRDTRLANALFHIYGVLLVVSAVAFHIFQALRLIGPYDIGEARFVGILYIVLAVCGALLVRGAKRDRII